MNVATVNFTNTNGANEVISSRLYGQFLPANAQAQPVQNTIAVTNTEQKAPKKGCVESFLNFIGNVKKVFVNIKEWTIGTAKGLFEGAIAGGITALGALGLGKVMSLKKHEKAMKINKPLYIGAGVVAGLAVLLKNLYDTKLNINKKSHDIDVVYVSTPMITK